MTRWNGDHMLPSSLFRPALRDAWRWRTLGEIHAATGVSPTTLHRIITADDQAMVQHRTAEKLRAGLAKLREAS